MVKGKKFPNIKSYARKIVTPFLVPAILFAGTARAESKDETVKKFSTEITYTKDNDVIKFRPFDYTSPDTQRIDFMLGRKFDSLTAFCYWKSDNRDRSWIGARTDYNIKSLEGKLNTNFQFRYFFGLNEASENHFYFIPTVDYRLNDTFKVGILGYGKKSEGKDPFFYVGPSLGVNLTKNISTFISYDKDIFGAGDMIYWKIDFKF